MIDDMYAIMDRINEIKSRFGLKKEQGQEKVNPAQTEQNYETIHKKTLEQVKKPDRDYINTLADKHASNNNVPSSLIKAMIDVESGYNPKAVSPKGARGLMQLMPSVLKDMGISNPFVPEENIKGGVTLMKELLETYKGDYKKALAAYNAGKKAVDRHDGVPDYKETQNYVKSVIDSYMKNK
ncbi:MAG: lytic transglycosylase domain-containing protein [bacterium]|nr:lytic transglycosylase domain-containing protein [bacterium]